MKTTAKKTAKVEEGRIYRDNLGSDLQWKIEDDSVWLRECPGEKWAPSGYSVERFLSLVISGDFAPDDNEPFASPLPSPAPITAKLFAAYDTRSGVVYYETAGESKAKVLRVVKATLPGDRDVKVIPLTVTYTPPMAKTKGAKRK